MRIGRRHVLATEQGDAGRASESGGRGRREVKIVALVLVLSCAAVFAGRLWWTHPLKRSVSLPPGIEQGETLFMGGTLPAPRTKSGGMFSAEDLRSVNHEWVITAIWYPRGGPEESADLRLGESAHFDGLGTVTWLKVSPPPIISIDFGGRVAGGEGGWKFNLVLDPGVALER
ncbi:hypothetical protein AIF0345_2972 [Actinomyces israelii]|nr:hypothetical protein AIF0345_2972 [Actinomyces israelii]